jgi:hypothetical protein
LCAIGEQVWVSDQQVICNRTGSDYRSFRVPVHISLLVTFLDHIDFPVQIEKNRKMIDQPNLVLTGKLAPELYLDAVYVSVF